MPLKLVAAFFEFSSDSDPNKRWNSPFVGVLPSGLDTEYKIDRFLLAAVTRYRPMCSVIGEAGSFLDFMTEILADIAQLEAGTLEAVENSTEGWEFTITREGVHFHGLYDQGDGGDVTLAQFKLAVQTYLRFLQDPERKPIEVVFPED